MKKWLLTCVIALSALTFAPSADAAWRHVTYSNGWGIYVIHPTGALWYYRCEQNKAGKWQCGFSHK